MPDSSRPRDGTCMVMEEGHRPARTVIVHCIRALARLIRQTCQSGSAPPVSCAVLCFDNYRDGRMHFFGGVSDAESEGQDRHQRDSEVEDVE